MTKSIKLCVAWLGLWPAPHWADAEWEATQLPRSVVSWRRVGEGGCQGSGGDLGYYVCQSGYAISTVGQCQVLCSLWNTSLCGGVTYGESWCQLWVNGGAVLAPSPSLGECGDGYGGGWDHTLGGTGTLPITSINRSAGVPGDCYARSPGSHHKPF
eukprot:m.38554 g.38554  ORF g.38554 m.38554 type:complete len:156 (+) comp13429_c0_seq3:107-574(+)